MSKYRKMHKNTLVLFAVETYFEKQNIICLYDTDKIVPRQYKI